MTILLVLVPISVGLLGIAIWAFVWAVRSGQFDNLDSASLAALVGGVPPPQPPPDQPPRDGSGRAA